MADADQDVDIELASPEEVEIVDNQGVEEEAEFPFYTITRVPIGG